MIVLAIIGLIILHCIIVNIKSNTKKGIANENIADATLAKGLLMDKLKTAEESEKEDIRKSINAIDEYIASNRC